MRKKSQISLEYIILAGFLTFVLISVLSIAVIYSSGSKDRIKIIQINNFANKVLSTSETVFFYGQPSKATISVYLPEGVRNISISGNTLYIETQTSSGIEKNGFYSKVPISGSISTSPGIKKITFVAETNQVILSIGS